MKRKQLRLMSFVLAAALILSSANAGSGAFASGTDEREEQPVAFLEDTLQGSEQISEAAEENNEQAEEQPAEPKVAKQEDIAETAVMTEADEGQQSELPQEDTVADLSETELPKARGVAASDLVNTLITDTTLFNMVLAIYNENASASKTASTFTYADLSAYTGALDFSSRTGAANVKSVVGLGLAENAASINMSSFTQVKEIAAKEFQNCKMTSVSLPPNLEKIGEQAFESCINLEAINAGTKPNTLPTSLKEVGQQAFGSASALKEITLPSFTAGGTILQNATSLFANCSSIEKITIGKSIQTIPVSAFSGAGTKSADGVSLIFESGSQLDKILGSAFNNMKFTTEGTLNLANCTRLSSIADEAFKGATNLSTVILPKDLTSLQFGSNTFAKTTLENMYVSGSKADGVFLPDCVTAIGAGCFFGNEAMKSVSLSPNISVIPDYTFDGCTALASIEQRQTSGQCKVAEIGDCAFRSTAIEDTDFLLAMNQLKIIGYQKLSVYSVEKANDKVLSLDLGGDSADVKVVSAVTHEKTQKNKPCGSEVFSNCNSLTSVSLPASVQQIGSRAFYFVNNQDRKELTDTITTTSNIETVVWNSSTTDKNVERKIYSEAFYGNQNLTKVVLPENKGKGETLSIDAYAFCNCKALETIGTATGKNVFPVTLQEIGVGAFEFCASIPSITICSTETGTCPMLETKVFQHCRSLASATLPKEITEIPDHFFYNCPIATFSVGTGTAIERFGILSFVGNQFVHLDLSKYTSLSEIGAGAFANEDTIVEGQEWDKSPKLDPLGAAKCGGPKLTTVTLPTTVSNTLHINSGVFSWQLYFNTMKTPANGSNNTVYIPDYVKEPGTGVFAATGVSNVIWQADTTGKNQWKTISPQLFEYCTNIVRAEDVLPTGNYVEYIGKRAFFGSMIQSADLTHYTALKQIGSGSVPSTVNQLPGVFEQCMLLDSVKLPKTAAFTVEEKTFRNSTLGSDGGTIDLGGVTSLGKESMKNCTEITQISFPESLKEIKDEAFSGCNQLQTVDFGSLQKIGPKAFMDCSELVLTKKGLPDTLLEIGNDAFKESKTDGKIGTVVFNSNLKSIGTNAFEKSGLTKIDFSKAKSLEKIGNKAFSDTALTEFNLSGTKVTEIGTILQNNKNLEKAIFGEEVLYINKDALAGCPKLRNFEFASTTTVSNQVFYTKGGEGYGTTTYGSDNPGTIAITVNTPAETVVPIGRKFDFPYYVNQKGKSNFDYILVGNPTSPDTIDQYMKVTANLTDGYYKQRQSNEAGNKYKVTDPSYYEKVEPAPSVKVESTKQEVDTIRLEGLKPTDGTIEFRIVCSISFECQDKEKPVSANKFSADYHLKVTDTPIEAVLYKDNKKQELMTAKQTNIQAISGRKVTMQYYYDIEDKTPGSTPDTYDLTIETSNPDVLYPGVSASAKKQASCTTNATRTSNGNVTANTSAQTFYLIPSGIGTAEITIYPKGYPQYSETYTYTVNSDIQSIKLAIPKEYSGDLAQGATFSVFSEYKNCLGQTVSVEDMSTYDKYSNQKIVFTSDNPDYVSVDQLGNVTVLKADKERKSVKITATASASEGGKAITATVTVKIKADGTTGTGTGTEGVVDPKVNEKIVDPATGATVQVTKTSKKDLEGEVKFVKSQANSSTAVIIPDTITIGGIQYKVTTVSANAFKNNTSIKTVTIGKYVKQIEDNAFYGCKSMTKITLPASLEKIGKNAFYGCKKLKTITIPNKAAITEIGEGAFYNCVALTKITIPVKVRTIGAKAFYNCKKLRSITIKSTVLTSVGKNAFKNIHKKAVIKVPKKKLKAYKALLKGKGQKKTVKIKK